VAGPEEIDGSLGNADVAFDAHDDGRDGSVCA
jgi:hypothetical protein